MRFVSQCTLRYDLNVNFISAFAKFLRIEICFSCFIFCRMQREKSKA